jgi:hypothetical protein
MPNGNAWSSASRAHLGFLDLFEPSNIIFQSFIILFYRLYSVPQRAMRERGGRYGLFEEVRGRRHVVGFGTDRRADIALAARIVRKTRRLPPKLTHTREIERIRPVVQKRAPSRLQWSRWPLRTTPLVPTRRELFESVILVIYGGEPGCRM